MKRLVAMIAVAVLGLAGAATGAGRREKPTAPPEGLNVRIRFTSQVPDDYYVLSGPGASYARFRVNDDLRRALESYAARGTGSGVEVGVRVHLKSVVTDYHEVGAGRAPHRREAVRTAALGPILLADEGLGEVSIPDEITKTVVLFLESEVTLLGGEPRRRAFKASATEVILRERWDRWAYNYDDVIHAAIANAVVEVDRVLREDVR
ncbi:MAG: hypothetical protein HGA98_00350 [Deltaproteobacteria bacterium]|nr:hypothetical protein [Deltaproteobacteria bacterium]